VTSVRVPVRTRPERPARSAPAQQRPRLRVVTPDYVPARVQRRRARLLAVAVSLLVGLGLLGIACLHVVLTQGQFELDRINARAEQEQQRFEQLRLEVAELESPERVVAAAQERLGMVPPPGVTYLTPSGPAAEQREATPAPKSASGPPTSWAEVKPHLSSDP
jgi:cell division protein FtsL